MKRLNLLILGLLLTGSIMHTHAQEYFFRSYSIEQGLPNSSIYCALEDSRGEMWIGTDGSGICRFNGIDLEVMDRSDGLSGNIVRSVFEDSRGRIWIGTDAGLNRYDGSILEHIADTLITETAVMTINEDRDGNLWVGTESMGLFRISESDSIPIQNISQSEGLASIFITDIDFDMEGRIWLSMIGGVNVMEYHDGEINVVKLAAPYDIPNPYIWCGSMDPEGNMWFGSLGSGVFMIPKDADLNNVNAVTSPFLDIISEDRIWDIHWTGKGECYVATETQGVICFTGDKLMDHFTKEKGLRSDQIYSITENAKGDLWFSTLGKGILLYENKLLVKYTDQTGIQGTRIFDVEVSHKGEIMIGTDEGFSVYEFRGDIPVLNSAYTKESGLPFSEITSIEQGADNTWLAGSGGVIRLEKGKIHIPDFNAGLSENTVNCLLEDSRGTLLIGTKNGYSAYINNELHRIDLEERGFISNEVQTIIEHSNGDIWLGTLGGIIRRHGEDMISYDKEEGLMELNVHALAEDSKGDIWIGTFGGGIFKYSQVYDSLQITLVAGSDVLSSTNIYSLAFLNDSVLIAATESGFDQIHMDPDNTISRIIHYDMADGYPGGGNNLNALLVHKNLAWFGNSEGLVRYDPSRQNSLDPPKIQINRLKLFFEEQDWSAYGETRPWFNIPEDLSLPYSDDHLTIGFSSILYGDHSGLSYSYFLEGQSKDWSPYLNISEVDLPGMRSGKYTFMVRAKNKFGVVGDTASFNFEIRPPFWMQPWFIITAIIVLAAAVVLYVRWRTRKLQLENIRLEKIVEERTREVVAQKEEIERQHGIVKHQNEEIEASIHYAERIQKAIIPSEEILKDNFTDSFILWRPQHIVSGDFYWVGQKNDHIIFTAADCTGHGVPGAFMSMLGVSFLNQIILEEGTVDPGQILDKLRQHIVSAFSQREHEEGDRKDGMDIAMCSFNTKTRKLYFAGAYNPLFQIRPKADEYELFEHNASKMPVGLYAIMDPFETLEIDFKKGDSLYMFSDGFPDQFGGERFKKFMKKRFREMLLNNQEKALPDQKKVYNEALEAWMSFKDPDGEEIIQTDDVIVMGVKL